MYRLLRVLNWSLTRFKTLKSRKMYELQCEFECVEDWMRTATYPNVFLIFFIDESMKFAAIETNGGIYLTKLSWVFFRKYCLFVHTFRIHCLWFSCLIFGSCNKRNLPYLTKYQCTHNRNTRILLSMIYYQLIHLEFFNAIDEEIQTTYIEHWTRRKDTHYNKS